MKFAPSLWPSALVLTTILVIHNNESLASALSLRQSIFTSKSLMRTAAPLDSDNNDEEVETTTSSSWTSAEGRRRYLQQVNDNENVWDAVIIGAGWAGLGAANTLKDQNILVLEARDYIGGRSRTVTLQDGVTTTELGSAWIVGVNDQNPLYQVAASSSVGIIPTSNDFGAIYSDVYGVSEEDKDTTTGQDHLHKNAHRVPDQEINPVVTDLSNEFYAFQEPLQESTEQDQSLRTVANKFVKANDIQGDERLALEYLLDSYIVTEYGASLKDLSLWWWNSDAEVIGGLALLQQGVNEQGKARGYSGILDEYAAPVLDKIQFNAKVTEIDWNSNETQTTGLATVDYLQNGEFKSVQARHVIVTVPLGVLKRGTIKFKPNLPLTKQRAIEKLGMGLLNKAILKWDDSANLPWPGDVEWLERIAPLGQQGQWTTFFDLYPSTGYKMIIAWTAGREADRVEQLSNNEIQAEVMDSLAAMFGDNVVPPPQEVIVTRWRSDEYAGGSYSYYQVGSTKKHRVNLGTSLYGRLFFAGEATSTDYFATTRGALETGIKAGNRVLDRLGSLSLSHEQDTATVIAESPASGAMRSFVISSRLVSAVLTIFSVIAAIV